MIPQTRRLSAFASGTVVPIESVPDPVFASRMMGDGVAIEPVIGVLYAPCDGNITQVHGSNHACILATADGARLLLHIGIDTVLLKGEGFTARVATGDSVRAGQVLIEFDIAVLKRHQKPLVTMLIIENGDDFKITSRSDPRPISVGEILLTLASSHDTDVTEVDIGITTTATATNATSGESANGWALIRHAGGLHARPCAILANAVKPFAASVTIHAHGKTANARSATAIMGLAIAEGEEIEIRASGANAGDALEAAIMALETTTTAEHTLPAATGIVPSLTPAAPLQAGQLAGVSASPGLASGVTVRFEHAAREIRELGEGEILERRALSNALHAALGDIEALIADAEQRGLAEQADIFAAHRVLVEDPELIAAAEQMIAEGKSAAFAWHAASETQCATLIATGNPLLAGRATDLHDIERQVLRQLSGDTLQQSELPPHAVVIAADLAPSDFSVLERANVAAIVTAQGGPTSHIAILARARGIPTLVAVGPQLDKIPGSIKVIVDADHGVLDTAPTPDALAAARSEIDRRSEVRNEAIALAHKSALTTDGARIEIAANIATVGDAGEAVRLGAESVGLLRTELLFMDRQTAPSVAEQQTAYQAIVDALEGRNIIIRTLDVGADKSLPYIVMPAEENPALGLRGIRLGLSREALLCDQLRAILAIRPLSVVRIMLPMIADLGEIVATRALLDRLRTEAGITERIELGVMIETPAAALLADQLAEVADFFSVGTNDLTQYTLCMDRTNPALAARIDGLHPSVLRLIAQASDGAARHGKWLGVCGAMASDPLAVPLLIGLGASELSASPAVIPEIKAVIRRLSLTDCQGIAKSALNQTSADAVRQLVRRSWPWLGTAC